MAQTITRNERRINGSTVRLVRRLKGLTQAQVATQANKVAGNERVLDHTTVAHTEKGRQPTEPTMFHIANGLGVDIDEITHMTVVYVVVDEPDAA